APPRGLPPFPTRRSSDLRMPDATTTLTELKEAMRQFVAERRWEPFHSPKNLVMGLAVEAAELMEHFLWMDNDESRRAGLDTGKRSEEHTSELQSPDHLVC